MAANFQACPSCARHIKVDEAACPFCGGALPEGFGAAARSGKGAAPLSRAAIIFMGATAVTGAAAACSSSSSGGGHSEQDSGSVVAAYGPAMIDSGAPSDAPTVGDVVALYGPAMVDSGNQEFDGPVAAYGPGPVPDSGNGGG